MITPVFRAQDVHREALAALVLIVKAASGKAPNGRSSRPWPSTCGRLAAIAVCDSSRRPADLALVRCRSYWPGSVMRRLRTLMTIRTTAVTINTSVTTKKMFPRCS